MATYAVWQATVTDNQGNITSGATVTVRNESTGLAADIFETRLGTAKANPFTTGADGFAQFYAAPGLYRIEATSPEGTSEWRNVRLIEVATEAEALAGIAGVIPDAEGVHAAFKQFGLGQDIGVLATQSQIDTWNALKCGAYRVANPTGLPGGTYIIDVRLASAHNGCAQLLFGINQSSLKYYFRTLRGGQPVPTWSEIHTTENGATNAEALAGTDNTKWMSPLRTSEAIDAKLSTFTAADDSHNHSSATITSISSAVAGAAIAGLSAGAVGSYAWLRHTSDTTSIVYGSSYSASVLRTSGINVFLSGDANQQGSGSGISVSGTWMAVGSCDSIGGSLTYAATIFKRIS